MPQSLWSTFSQHENFKRTLRNRLAFSIWLSIPISAIIVMFLLPDELESGRFCVDDSISQIVAVTVLITSYHLGFTRNKFWCLRHYYLRWPYIPESKNQLYFLLAGELHSASPCGCSSPPIVAEATSLFVVDPSSCSVFSASVYFRPWSELLRAGIHCRPPSFFTCKSFMGHALWSWSSLLVLLTKLPLASLEQWRPRGTDFLIY